MILLPTKGRPKSLARFIERYRVTKATLPVTLLIDEADLETYKEVELPDNFTVMSMPAGSPIGECFNIAFRQMPDLEYYGVMADDVMPETEFWDVILRDACLLHGISWGDDEIQGENLPTHPFLSGDLVRKAGYIAPPGVKHCYVDNYWRLLSINKPGGYMPQIKTPHRHHLVGAEVDQTYADQPDMEGDRMAFVDFIANHYQDLRKRIA